MHSVLGERHEVWNEVAVETTISQALCSFPVIRFHFVCFRPPTVVSLGVVTVIYDFSKLCRPAVSAAGQVYIHTLEIIGAVSISQVPLTTALLLRKTISWTTSANQPDTVGYSKIKLTQNELRMLTVPNQSHKLSWL